MTPKPLDDAGAEALLVRRALDLLASHGVPPGRARAAAQDAHDGLTAIIDRADAAEAARDAALARAGELERLLREFYEAEGAFGCGCICTAGGRCAGCRARLSAAGEAARRALGGEG